MVRYEHDQDPMADSHRDLVEAYLACHLAEDQAEVDHYINDDSDTSDGSDSDQEMHDWDGFLPHLIQALVEASIQLHSSRYLTKHVNIQKTGTQLYLILHEYKNLHPRFFAAISMLHQLSSTPL
jgi:hypothetical protein